MRSQPNVSSPPTARISIYENPGQRPLRGDFARQLDLTGRVAPDEELAITAISVGDLVHGATKSQRAADNLARLDVLLPALTILPYDEWSACRFGQLKAQLERAGEVISDLDLQIDSISLDHDAALVTHNQKHFSRLTNLAGLVLDDWLD